MNIKLILFTIFNAIKLSFIYEYALIKFIFFKLSYSNSSLLFPSIHARVQVFSLSLIFKMWSLKHYRSPSFKQDMLDNLKNVAIPGTGIPLSMFCYSYITVLLFLLFINPIICFAGAINKARIECKLLSNKYLQYIETFILKTMEYYLIHLLYPTDWFSLWRLNCRLVSYHSLLTNSKSYNQEDKWTFLKEGRDIYSVPVSPFMDIESIVCKNKNIEGGMGIYFYKNATVGGDWIIQGKLDNAEWLNKLLPSNAPLSTMRVITGSSLGLSKHNKIVKESNLNNNINEISKHVTAFSSVLRLGREGAATDHSSVLFDVDIDTGKIKDGLSNAEWYQLGFKKAMKCPWLPVPPCKNHPDKPYPICTGETIPGMKEAIDIVIRYVILYLYS